MAKQLTPIIVLLLALPVFEVGTANAMTDATGAVPSKIGTVYFNGRATHMGMLSSYETSVGNPDTLVQQQAPTVWDYLSFLNNDIQIVPDSRYGRVYSIRAGVGSHNPSYDPGPGVAASELSRRRANDLGKWDWFAGGFRINSGLTEPSWVMLYQFGYPTLSSPPLALELVKQHGTLYYGILRNAGLLTRNSSGFYGGTILENKALLPVPYHKWVDFIIGVKWATDNNGELRVYGRVEGKHSYKLLWSVAHTSTWQYGTTPSGSVNADGTSSSGGQVTVIDHGGLYFGYWDHRASFPTEYVLETGMTRSSAYAAAVSTLPK